MENTKTTKKVHPFGTLTKEKPTLDEIQAHFKGKGGGPEGETDIIDANADKKDGFVWVYSNKADAAKIIERCKENIIDYNFLGSGVQLQIDRKAFRGIHCAFRKTK